MTKSGSFSFPPTSLKHEFYGLPSGFTRLIKKINYVCHGQISVHVNLHDNQTKWTLISNIKISRCGKQEKEPKKPVFVTTQELFLLFRVFAL